MAQGGLGRGLNSLIQSSKPNNEKEYDLDLVDDKDRVLHINPEMILANTDQPRQDFDNDHLKELVSSIKEHGVLQPLIAIAKGDKYELIAGERRLRASKLAGLKTVPLIVRGVDKQEKLELALIENLQRQDLSPLETAIAYKKLIEEFKLTQEQVAKKVGKSRPSITNTLRLLNLPQEIKDALMNKKITEAHAKLILSLKDEKEQLSLFKKITQQNLNVHDSTKISKTYSGANKTTRKNYKDEAREQKLQSFFNAKSQIRRKKEGGEIIIEFYDEDDLEEILKKVK
jgi:ParB family chromosome partitioning protein